MADAGTGRTLRVAVAGTGAFGRNHLRVYREMEGVELVAAIEPSAERAAEVAEQYGIPVFDSVEAALAKFFADKTEEFYARGIKLLPRIWQKIVETDGKSMAGPKGKAAQKELWKIYSNMKAEPVNMKGARGAMYAIHECMDKHFLYNTWNYC